MTSGARGELRGASLRVATRADLSTISHLEREIFGPDAWTPGMLADELSGEHRTYLAVTREDGSLAGYGGLLAVGNEGDIQTLAIAPEFRGRGWGRALLDALLAQARTSGVRDVFLEVRADNPSARGLYESFGFAEIGIRPRYYQPDDVDAVVMKIELGKMK